jgi:hypothetical protein
MIARLRARNNTRQKQYTCRRRAVVAAGPRFWRLFSDVVQKVNGGDITAFFKGGLAPLD